MLATIPLDMIENGQRLRDISEAQVAALVNSIGDVGLLNPITVYPRQLFRSGKHVEGYGLIAGLHRKTAYERLGLVEIEANVLDLPDLERQIAECDENLCAPTLSPSERARFTNRRKEAYEALHPEAKHGGDRKSDQVDNLSTRSFAADQAEATGVDERTVRRDASRGEHISDEALFAVKGTPLDTGVFLDELKKVDPLEQVKTVKERLAALRDAARPKPTLAVANRSKIDADVKARAAKEVAEIIAEHVPGEWWDAVKSNLYAAGAANIANALTNITGEAIMDRRHG